METSKEWYDKEEGRWLMGCSSFGQINFVASPSNVSFALKLVNGIRVKPSTIIT
ncbi:hypothetical protein PISMIDRAFT_676106 [Pisolithus microcarpus 441]|uniref:Uncharacterized protein n=1 Tax=Pisolithus microcarpus 441 TaxID=765257 RepID=A0A0D0A2L2_9AGAM|nr:hypothetical protein PISMIDRAFT_676106 [Pisolithus microcarpus 441]